MNFDTNQCFKELRANLIKYRLSYLCLISLILIGSFIRSYNFVWGPELYPLSGDDFFHFKWSGFNLDDNIISNNLKEVILNSYRDAHPPLRNVLLNICFNINHNRYLARLIALIPGILLIPLVFILIKNILKNSSFEVQSIVALSITFVITFMRRAVELSFETRPYMLTTSLQIIMLLCVLNYKKGSSSLYLLGFFISSFLIMISSYPASLTVVIGTLIIIYKFFFKHSDFSLKRIIILSSGILLLSSTCLFQYRQISKTHSLQNYTLVKSKKNQYISNFYIQDLTVLPKRFRDFFKIFFYRSEKSTINNFASLLCLIYLFGLLVLIRNKSYELLIFSLAPVFITTILALLKIYPLSLNRHCFFLIPSVLISFASFFEFILNIRIKLFGKLLIALFCICYIHFSGVVSKDNQYYLDTILERNFFTPSALNANKIDSLLNLLPSVNEANRLIIFEPRIGWRIKYHQGFLKLESEISNKQLEVLKENLNYCIPRIYKQSVKLCKSFPQHYESIVFVSYSNRVYNKEVKRLTNSIKRNGFNKSKQLYSSTLWDIKEFKKVKNYIHGT